MAGPVGAYLSFKWSLNASTRASLNSCDGTFAQRCVVSVSYTHLGDELEKVTVESRGKI